jgi:thymidylate kinase
VIVEFIGCTGAGKTTLISKVRDRLTQTTQVTSSFDLVAAPLGLGRVIHPTARNLIQEFAGLPFFMAALPRHQAFVNLALRMLARQANFSIFTINNLRSLERKLGVYEIIRRYEHERIVMVDEGTVLSAHNVFVFTNAFYTPEEIAQFAALIPLPDVIVYIRAPVDSLINRTLQRTDPPRELKSRDRALIERYVNRAVTLFDQLVETEEIRDRVLIVENPESADQGCDAAVEYITQFVLNCEPASQ